MNKLEMDYFYIFGKLLKFCIWNGYKH